MAILVRRHIYIAATPCIQDYHETNIIIKNWWSNETHTVHYFGTTFFCLYCLSYPQKWAYNLSINHRKDKHKHTDAQKRLTDGLMKIHLFAICNYLWNYNLISIYYRISDKTSSISLSPLQFLRKFLESVSNIHTTWKVVPMIYGPW